MAELSDFDRKVLIFCRRVGWKAACLLDQRPPPRPDRAWHYRDAVQTRKRAPVQVLRCDVFKRLPARQYIYSVANLGISRNCADDRIIEAMSKRGHRSW